jgi:hypothetical protein
MLRNEQQSKPVIFRMSRGPNGTIVAAEYAGSARGEFADLSSAMRFASETAASRGQKADVRFDASLAMIRAAG